MPTKLWSKLNNSCQYAFAFKLVQKVFSMWIKSNNKKATIEYGPYYMKVFVCLIRNFFEVDVTMGTHIRVEINLWCLTSQWYYVNYWYYVKFLWSAFEYLQRSKSFQYINPRTSEADSHIVQKWVFISSYFSLLLARAYQSRLLLVTYHWKSQVWQMTWIQSNLSW